MSLASPAFVVGLLPLCYLGSPFRLEVVVVLVCSWEEVHSGFASLANLAASLEPFHTCVSISIYFYNLV